MLFCHTIESNKNFSAHRANDYFALYTQKALEIYSELVEQTADQTELLENYICVLLAAEKTDEAQVQYDSLKEKFPESKRLEEFSKFFVVEESEELEDSVESEDSAEEN